jgi:hypothetical protein
MMSKQPGLLLASITLMLLSGVDVASGGASGPDLGDDAFVPPPPQGEAPPVGDAPQAGQPSEFMAGRIVYSVFFPESSGGSGYCSPADASTEDWTVDEQNLVLAKLQQAYGAFWETRANAPSPLSFIADNQGSWPTSCEPINRGKSEDAKWISDVLTALGYPACPDWNTQNPCSYFNVARTFAHTRRVELQADWAFLIFVADSSNDFDGLFPDSASPAKAALNGPYMMMTYDNGKANVNGYTTANMHSVAAHETGHIFGAGDEYGTCNPAQPFGYLGVPNTSCNNGGDTSDISIMGGFSELTHPTVDVSVSARGAIGWRNPAPGDGGKTVVDVVRTQSTGINAHPDPTADSTPTFNGGANNNPFPPSPPRSGTMVSKVSRVEWKRIPDPWILATSTDGAFDEESETYTFTPGPLPDGTYTFWVRSINQYGHISNPVIDTLTIDQDLDGIVAGDNCPAVYNPTQANFDPNGPTVPPPADALGDVCDPDDDEDENPDETDVDDDNDRVRDDDEVICGGATPSLLRPERIDGPFDNVDDDGDTQVDEPLPVNAAYNHDCDGDGFDGSAEAGTLLCGNTVNDDAWDDSTVNDGCPSVTGQVGLYSEAQFNLSTSDQDACGYSGWPLDFISGGIPDSTNRINITDLVSFLAGPSGRRLDTRPGDTAYSRRWDLIPGPNAGTGTWIQVGDLTALFGGFTGFPPMSFGNKVFGTPFVCPWPP